METVMPDLNTSRHPVVARALKLLAREVRETDVLTSPAVVRDYLRLSLADRRHEVFVVVFLDNQHRVIETVEMFRGTLSHTAVYPREIVIEALQRNAAAVIFAHNHPSDMTEPSVADRTLTDELRRALALVDVDVLDHFVVTRCAVVSFAERGLL
ncbi:MAG: DNA repair protein RadC [Burkholderiaceae bacterium]